MTLETGAAARTLVDLLADDESIIPAGSVVRVIGHEGQQPVVDLEDFDTGEHVTATCQPWELRPAGRLTA